APDRGEEREIVMGIVAWRRQTDKGRPLKATVFFRVRAENAPAEGVTGDIVIGHIGRCQPVGRRHNSLQGSGDSYPLSWCKLHSETPWKTPSATSGSPAKNKPTAAWGWKRSASASPPIAK